MAITYNPDNTMSMSGPGMTYGGGLSQPGDRYFGSGDMGGQSPAMSMNDSLFTPRTQSMQATNQPNFSNLLTQLIQSMQSGQQQANAQNTQQYNALMKSVAGTRKSAEGLFGQLGQTGNQQINLQEQQQRGQTEQDLTSRGLGNTSIRSSMLGGVARNAQMERQQLNEGIAGQKIGTEMGLGQMTGDAILSRQNQQPNLGLYMNLIQSLAGMGGMGGGQNQTQIVRK
jgi:hypothetical protein